MKALLIEVTLLHHHVAAATRTLADADDLTNGQVSVLRSIATDGPSTVPALARQRAVARQPVQRMVDALESLGLVRLVANPHHKRSRLVALTAAGRRRLAAMEQRQSGWTRPLATGLSPGAVAAATRVVRRIRERIAEPESAPHHTPPSRRRARRER